MRKVYNLPLTATQVRDLLYLLDIDGWGWLVEGYEELIETLEGIIREINREE